MPIANNSLPTHNLLTSLPITGINSLGSKSSVFQRFDKLEWKWILTAGPWGRGFAKTCKITGEAKIIQQDTLSAW